VHQLVHAVLDQIGCKSKGKWDSAVRF
jgi:hypothetical protein